MWMSVRGRIWGGDYGKNQGDGVDHENLQRLLNGQDYTMEDLYAVSDAYLETACTKGYLEAAIEYPTPISACNWFTRVERGEKLRMVRPERDLQMLFDDQGEVLPTAIPYDYINGHMRDGVYDLKRAQALLDGHSQIFPIDGKNLRVRHVPSYNVSPGCKKTFVLVCTNARTNETHLGKSPGHVV